MEKTVVPIRVQSCVFATDDPYDGAHWWRTHTMPWKSSVNILGAQRLGGFPSASEPGLNMPVRPRRPNESRASEPLLLLGIGS